MRPSLAQKRPEDRRKALILGPSEVACLISEGLQEEGFETYLHEAMGGQLPSLADPDGLEKLRAIFRDFKAGAGEAMPAVHPGTSFWGERPEFAGLCAELGIEAVCPPSRVLALFANKLTFFAEADQLGVPNLLIHSDPLHSLREIEQEKLRYPYILKAMKGGILAAHYVVHDAEELRTKFPLWMEQLHRSCGEVFLLVERYLESSRQVVVPFVRFQEGHVEIFPMIDASLQCRHRKFVEFCPPGGIDDTVLSGLAKWTQKIVTETKFVGLGTLEFLVDGAQSFLINGSARLNHSFHLWEKVAGTSAVAWQLATLESRETRRHPARTPDRKWSAGLAARIYAEDPVLQLPQPGYIQFLSEQREWAFPAAEAKLTVAVEAGQSVHPGSTGLLGLLWVGAQERQLALKTAVTVLEQVWIAGSLQTNERFISELLSHPWVREGMFHSGFVDEEFLPSIRPPAELLPLFAGVCQRLPLTEGASAARWVVGDQWARTEQFKADWTEGPRFWSAPGSASQGLSGTLRAGSGSNFPVCAFPLAGEKWQVRIGAWTMVVRRAAPANSAEKKQAKLLALVSGRVHSILFRAESQVPAHEPLVMIESLGMLVPHALPVEAVIRQWNVGAEDMVRAGDELARIDVLAKV